MNPKSLNLNLEHLIELEGLKTLLVEKYKPLKIICFAYVQSNRTAQSCFQNHRNEKQSHYFLLLITASKECMENIINDFINQHYNKACISLLAHSAKTVAEQLVKGSVFFQKVIRYGAVVYKEPDYEGFSNDLFGGDSSSQGDERTFEQRKDLAIGFLQAAELCLEQGRYRNVVFLLHQVVEHLCIALILFHCAYRTDYHNLSRLLKFCLCFSNDIGNYFFSKDADETRLFRLLEKGYSEARYKNEFAITKDEVAHLMTKVKGFVRLVEKESL